MNFYPFLSIRNYSLIPYFLGSLSPDHGLDRFREYYYLETLFGYRYLRIRNSGKDYSIKLSYETILPPEIF